MEKDGGSPQDKMEKLCCHVFYFISSNEGKEILEKMQLSTSLHH
jgi:hypothetical protein